MGKYAKLLGQVIKECRVKKKLTRKELAAELCIKYSTLANYENGVREPDLDTLVFLAKYFGLKLDELVGIKEMQ